jgi:hypothetical protein
MMASNASPEAYGDISLHPKKTSNWVGAPNNKQSKSTEALNTMTEDNYFIPTTNAFSSLQQDAKETQSSAQVAPHQLKKERVPTITIKWKIQLVRDQLIRASFRGDQ